MKLSQNLLAGLISAVWTMIVGFVVVPYYLHYLGIEAYGLIGFFTTIQSLLNFLDLGLAPTVSREVARFASRGNINRSGRLLYTLAIIYWMVAVIILLGFYLLAPLISEHWLRSNEISSETLESAVFLIGFVIACRWPHGLYRGALLGAERMALVSIVNLTVITAGSIGAVLIIAFVSPSIQAFFLWQAAMGLLLTMVMRFLAWRVVGVAAEVRFDISELKRIWRFTAGAASIAVAGLILSQLDKLLLSKLVDLDELGVYMLAVLLAGVVSALVVPVFNVVYPRLSALVARDQTDGIILLYRSGSRALAIMIFPIAMIIGGEAQTLVHLWTGDSDVAIAAAPVVLLLASGSAIHGVMHFPYALQLAHGRTWIALTISLILILVSVPLLILLTRTYGILGGALAWLMQQIGYLALGTWLTHRYMLKDLGAKWLFHDIGIPAAITLLVGFASHYSLSTLTKNPYLTLMLAGFSAGIAMLLSLAASPHLVTQILASVRQTDAADIET
jgi:O-antigen/teichoic acid export membrane protein